jgi:hypothetical protein
MIAHRLDDGPSDIAEGPRCPIDGKGWHIRGGIESQRPAQGKASVMPAIEIAALGIETAYRQGASRKQMLELLKAH